MSLKILFLPLPKEHNPNPQKKLFWCRYKQYFFHNKLRYLLQKKIRVFFHITIKNIKILLKSFFWFAKKNMKSDEGIGKIIENGWTMNEKKWFDKDKKKCIATSSSSFISTNGHFARLCFLYLISRCKRLNIKRKKLSKSEQ